jgi:cytochrome P450
MLFDVAETLNPYPTYAHLRRHYPLYFEEAANGWMVFRYAEVEYVLNHPALFSSAAMGGPGSPLGQSLIASDPPRHRELRSMVDKAFTPRRVEQLAPRIREIAHRLLDTVEGQSRFDFVEAFAAPLPVMVIAEILGIPPARHAEFKQWSDAAITFESTGRHQMARYFGELIAERRARRAYGDDLISVLLQVEENGQTLSPMEILGFCVLLLIAGNETTTNLLTHTLYAFHEHPEALEQVKANPTLIPAMNEEALRYRSPVQMLYRRVREEVTIEGMTLVPGQEVMAWVGSANRDEAVFANPDVFEITRSPNRHLAFGKGIHFCLGAPLARLEAKIAWEVLLERLPTLRMNPTVPPRRVPHFNVFKMEGIELLT